jgi:hypothetical protein
LKKEEQMLVEQPSDIQDELRMWRLGMIGVPTKYVAWNQSLAEASVERLKPEYIIHNQFMASDGWGDGVKFLHIIVEDKIGNLYKWKWSDSQNWYQHHPRGGWSLVYLKKGA